VTPRSASMLRVTLRGPELVGLDPGDPGASVRVLLPRDGTSFEMPTWNGNEFLHANGARARIRTLTPLEVRTVGGVGELDVDVVLHDDSPLTRWARTAAPGDDAAVSGTGSGYTVDLSVVTYLLLGDESAVPAIATLLPALPAGAAIAVLLERRPGAEPVDLPEHPGAEVTWSELAPGAAPGDTLVRAAGQVELEPDTHIWAAGEAAAVQRLRKYYFDERGVPRSHATIRGYWKVGRDGT